MELGIFFLKNVAEARTACAAVCFYFVVNIFWHLARHSNMSIHVWSLLAMHCAVCWLFLDITAGTHNDQECVVSEDMRGIVCGRDQAFIFTCRRTQLFWKPECCHAFRHIACFRCVMIVSPL